ncbi:hypothetical protein CEXT_798851 [Caerostris extrusa]|uniref:Uncharacterized protein n=1 Tax=Caerostris extrusa TaxID=172846 RepID=A0AAV4R8U8_CAEEX|nr:hypothetical protein CEXT_798851 [Caerostris extrusa]
MVNNILNSLNGKQNQQYGEQYVEQYMQNQQYVEQYIVYATNRNNSMLSSICRSNSMLNSICRTSKYTLHYKTDDGNWQHERLSSDADKYAQESSLRHQVPPVHDSLQQPGDGGPARQYWLGPRGRYCVIFFLLTLCEVGVLNALRGEAVWFAGL